MSFPQHLMVLEGVHQLNHCFHRFVRVEVAIRKRSCFHFEEALVVCQIKKSFHLTEEVLLIVSCYFRFEEASVAFLIN